MIHYNSQISKEKLEELNIVIEDCAKVSDGVILNRGCCILGDSEIGENCEIGANTVISNSKINKGVKVLISFIEDSSVGENTTVGPFATIKKDARIGGGCRIGNFVEIKNSIIGDGTKIAHLTYVGDAELGTECNLGCGVVFCNYNGLIKQRSKVGNRVFIGSNVNVVAPVNIADFAYIAAGSTVNKDIGEKEFVVARVRQTSKLGFDNPYLKNKK